MTTIGILGAGKVGSGLAAVLTAAGHHVLLTNSEPGSDRLAAAAAASGATPAATQQILAADIVVLAAPYAASLTFARDNANALAGKVLVDTTNPVTPDATNLVVSGDTSAAEQIAAAAPQAHVVKAFNTVLATTYTNPALRDTGQFVPIAGDDEAAVEEVRALVAGLGFEAAVVGPLETARFIEPTVMSLVHLGLFQGYGLNLGLALVRA